MLTGSRIAGTTAGRGNLAGYSFNGGLTWAFSAPRFSRCAGGAGLGNAGDYERATDPWLSFSPNGRLHAIGLVFDNSTPRNAVLAAFSDTGGASWSTPRIVRFDNPRALGNAFNDKETLTADPFDSSLVYATWQRIISPSEQVSARGYENAVSFFSEAWFARSTNGGQSWEPARPIFKERGVFTQTIGNQVEVLPDEHADQRLQLDSRREQPPWDARLYRRADPLLTRATRGRERSSSTVCWWTKSRIRRPATTSAPATSCRTGRSIGARIPPPRGNVYVVWMDSASTTPTTTTSCSHVRGTAG